MQMLQRRVLVETRDVDLQRTGQIPDREITDLRGVLRFRQLGGMELLLPATSTAVPRLQVPGSGIVVTLDDGVLQSGPIVAGHYKETAGQAAGLWRFEFVDDNWPLADLLAWPRPDSAVVADQGNGTVGTPAYDVRSGDAETVMRSYVDANIGPSAPTGRRIELLQLAEDLARGGETSASARFDVLGELLASIGLAAGLGFRIRQDDDHLLFEVVEPQDRSGEVRFSVGLGTAEEVEYSFAVHELSRAIVQGQGDLADRITIERASAESLASEALWGRRRERTIDQRQAADTTEGLAEMHKAGDEALAEGGRTLASCTVRPRETPNRRFVEHWNVGDVASAAAGPLVVENVIEQAEYSYGPAGFAVSAVLGDMSTAVRKPVLKLLEQQRADRARLRRLETRQ